MSNLDIRLSNMDIHMSNLDIRMSKLILEFGKNRTAKNSEILGAFRMFFQIFDIHCYICLIIKSCVQAGHMYVQVGQTYVQVGHMYVRSNNASTDHGQMELSGIQGMEQRK